MESGLCVYWLVLFGFFPIDFDVLLDFTKVYAFATEAANTMES